MSGNKRIRNTLQQVIGLGVPEGVPEHGVAGTEPRCPATSGCSPRPVRGEPQTDLSGAVQFSFFVHGDPKPKPRAVPSGNGHATFIPNTADDWCDRVRAAAVVVFGPGGIPNADAAYRLRLLFAFKRPKSHLRTGRFAGMLKPHAPRHHTQKPDFDNLEKALVDALGTWRDLPPLIWADDAQVVGCNTEKTWATPGTKPGCLVTITQLP